MKKTITILFWLYFAMMIFAPFWAEFSYLFEDMQLNPYDYARITDVEYEAVVVDEPECGGKVIITERLTFDIHAASRNNLFWELWRDLPEDYVDGVKVHYKVNSVKQIMDDGTEIVYERSPKLYWDDYDYVAENTMYGPGKWYHSKGPYNESAAQYECVFFYVDGLYREEVVFEIEYEMYNASLRYNDCSDLYLALYSGSTTKHLESFKADILFPNEDMPAPGNYDVYTYGTNANDFPVTESATKNPGYYTFSFELDEEDLQFRPYNQYIEFDLVAHGEDKHIFTEYASQNYYSNDDVLDEIYAEQKEYADKPAKYRSVKNTIFIISCIIGLFILAYNLMLNRRMNSKHVFFKPETEIDFYRDIPSDLDPNFAASFVFCKHKPPKDDSGVYSAILLSLARKEYIQLQEMNITDVRILIKNTGVPTPDSTLEPLTLCEQYYLNLLVRHATEGTITMSSFQSRVSSDFENTRTFAKNMDDSIVNVGVNSGYLQKADYNQPRKSILRGSKALWVFGLLFIILVNLITYFTRIDFAFGAFFILGACCLISSIFLKVNASKYVLLTQRGENEYAKWRGLYNFLNSDTLMNERTFVELPIWEKYLVYATAFGISEKVIQAINLRCPEAYTSPVLNNSYCSSGHIHHSSRSFRSTVRTSSSSFHYSGGSGGFGYGGGGRGGGGGGGGH